MYINFWDNSKGSITLNNIIKGYNYLCVCNLDSLIVKPSKKLYGIFL